MFGLTIVAVLAMSAVVASAASAAEFFHDAGVGVKARVTATNEGTHKFTAGIIGTIECKKATFTGTEFVTSSQPTVTVSPAYSECTFLGVANVAVNTNGCTYTFNLPTGTGPFTGTVNINCPAGKKIAFEAKECKIEVGAQGPLSSVTFTNQEAVKPMSVKVVASVTKQIKYTASGLGCAVIGEKEDGSYSGTAISTAETELGEKVGALVK